MSFREFLGKMTLRFILLRFGLALVLIAILTSLFIHFFTHEPLTFRTFFSYFSIPAFPVAILSVVHLIDVRAKERKACDTKNDA